MIPLISIALSLISNVTDLAHMFVSDNLDDRPAGISFYFENRHEEATFAFFDETVMRQADVMKQFSHFVRCWRTGREKAMHPRTDRDRRPDRRALRRRAHRHRLRLPRPSVWRAALEALPRPRDGHPRRRACRPSSVARGCGRTSATSASASTPSRISCTSTRVTWTCAGSTSRATARARTRAILAACRRRAAPGRCADAGVRPRPDPQPGRRRRRDGGGPEHPGDGVRPAPVLSGIKSARR